MLQRLANFWKLAVPAQYNLQQNVCRIALIILGFECMRSIMRDNDHATIHDVT